MNYTLIKKSLLALVTSMMLLPTMAQKGEPSKDNVLNLHSKYVDYYPKAKVKMNLVKDCGLISHDTKDQSATFQKAIDDLAAKGGGVLYVPKGTYVFRGVRFQSNIHIVVEPEVIFKPYWGDERKVSMFGMSGDKSKAEFIENCSIRCSKDGKQFTVDYSDKAHDENWGIRFMTVSLVRNFSICDILIKDSSTTYCAISFSPGGSKDMSKWEVSRPTNGEMKSITVIDADPGYGLVQMHGAKDVYLENLYAYGGVTLRLETGANTPGVGVYNVFARGLKIENGRCALMMGPHIAQNGTVKVDGVWAKNSTYAARAGEGVTVGKNVNELNVKRGRFASDSHVINIHSIYGETGQTTLKALGAFHPNEYSKIHYARISPLGKWAYAPSLAAALDRTGDTYDITYENVTTEGFPKYIESPEISISTPGQGAGRSAIHGIKAQIPGLQTKPVADKETPKVNAGRNKNKPSNAELKRMAKEIKERDGEVK